MKKQILFLAFVLIQSVLFISQANEKTILLSSARPGEYSGADIYRGPAGILDELKVLPTTSGQEKTNEEIFINYFMNNWDDIHDVVMRYHNVDPGLKGLVEISMIWEQGKLTDANVSSNSTGNPDFGLSLVEAMKKWTIPGLAEGWSSTIPIRTAIVGSDDPEFSECGIFTGNIIDKSGNPVNGAMVALFPAENADGTPDTVYTNREGVFICTLLHPGTWRVECTRKSYATVEIDRLTVEKGQHYQRVIIMEDPDRENR